MPVNFSNAPMLNFCIVNGAGEDAVVAHDMVPRFVVTNLKQSPPFLRPCTAISLRFDLR